MADLFAVDHFEAAFPAPAQIPAGDFVLFYLLNRCDLVQRRFATSPMFPSLRVPISHLRLVNHDRPMIPLVDCGGASPQKSWGHLPINSGSSHLAKADLLTFPVLVTPKGQPVVSGSFEQRLLHPFRGNFPILSRDPAF